MAARSEVERARINQESLFVRIRQTQSFFFVCSLLLLVPYILLVELCLFDEPKGEAGNNLNSLNLQNGAQVLFLVQNEDVIDVFRNRLALYLTPMVLLLLSMAAQFFYFSQAKQTRDGARVWYDITPHRSQVNSLARGRSLPPQSNRANFDGQREASVAKLSGGAGGWNVQLPDGFDPNNRYTAWIYSIPNCDGLFNFCL